MFHGELVLRNANIITMNPEQPRAEALVIQEGWITAIGSWDEVAPVAKGLAQLDLARRTVLPGFVDTHAHFLWTALSLAALDASGAEDHGALQEIVRRAVADAAPGELIFGMGYTEYALDTEMHGPIIDALDAVAPENPVYLTGVTGHSSAVNSLGLQSLDLAQDTPGVMTAPEGGPNGLLADEANGRAMDHFGALFGADEKAEEFIEGAIAKAHSVGITTLHALEGGSISVDSAVERFLASMPDLPLRFVLYYQILDVDRVLGLGLPRIGGCILLDGDVEPHTAALSEPYVDQPDCCGTLYYGQEEIDAFVLKAHRAGLQVAMHAVGDAAVEQALDAYEAALIDTPRADHRHRIEHCEVVREEQIQRAQRLGVALAIQPPFNYFWPHEEYVRTLGEERASKVDPVASLLRPGLLLAGGSDSTVTPLGPLIGVHAAVNHTNPAERISVQDALELYTSSAARIAFEESVKGSLEKGKYGDLVVLADDPFAVAQEHILDIPVAMTIIGGEVVYRR